MYLSETVKIPEIPGKITRRKMSNIVYVCKIQPFPRGIPKFPWVRPK